MKRLLFILPFLLFWLFANGQGVVEIVKEPVCWYVAGQDSSLTKYMTISSRTGKVSLICYVNANGEIVDVSASDVFTPGYCTCCDGGVLGGADQDWAFVDPVRATILDPLYRWGKTSIGTLDTTHLLRVDGLFQFNPEAYTTFDYQNLTDTTGTPYRGLLFRAPGGFSGLSNLSGASNNFTIAVNAVPTDRIRLGAYAFGGKFPASDDYTEAAWMEAFAEGDWNSTNRSASINFWITDSLTRRNVVTFEFGGRLELDRYPFFEDGTPLRLLGFSNTPKDVTVHSIGGVALPGSLLGLNDIGGLEWKDSTAVGGGSGVTNLTQGQGVEKDTVYSSTGTDALIDRDIQYGTPPTPSTDRDKSTGHVDPVDDRIRFYDPGISDYSLSRFDYTVATVADVLDFSVPLGEVVEVRSLGSRYKAQASGVTGYTTDSIGVIPIAGGGFAVYDSKHGVNPLDFGMEIGAVTSIHPGYTYSQKKAFWWANWKALKKASQFAIKTKSFVDMQAIQGTIEILWPKDNFVTVNNDELLKIVGSAKGTTFIDVKDEYQVEHGNHDIFVVENGGWLTIDNIKFEGKTYEYKIQTYDCILRNGGNIRDIKIQDTAQIYTRFWSNLSVGDTIFYDRSVSVKGEYGFVASFDSTTRIITLTADLVGVASETQGPDVVVGFLWPDNFQVETDSLSRYGIDWYIAENNYTLIDANNSQSVYNDFSEIRLENCDISKVRAGIEKSGSWMDLRIRNCKMQAYEIFTTFFNGAFANPSKLIVEDFELYDCGRFAAYEVASTVSAGRVWGSGFYTHPNVIERVRNGIVRNNIAAAWRQYSSSGPKPAVTGFFSTFDDITWYSNTEYNLLTSNSLSTKITNNRFLDGVLYIGNNTDIVDSRVYNLNLYNQDEPNPDSSSQFLINVLNSSVGTVSVGWNTTLTAKTALNFDNCTFFLPQSSSIFILAGAALNVRNCTIDFGTLASNTAIGNFVANLGEAKIRINNLQPNLSAKDKYFQGHFFSTSTYDLKPDIVIENSTINANPISTTQRGKFHRGIQIKNTILKGASYFPDVTILSLVEGLRQQTISTANATFTTYPFSSNRTNGSTFKDYIVADLITPGNIYMINGSLLRTLFLKTDRPDQNNTFDYYKTNIFEGSITVIPDQNLTIIPYGLDENSNFLGTDTIRLQAKKKYIFTNNPYYPLGISETTIRDTIATGNGSTTAFNLQAVFPGDRYAKGTMVLKWGANSVQLNGDGSINNSLVVGYADPFTRSFRLTFTTAPTSGQAVYLEYAGYTTYQHPACWTISETASTILANNLTSTFKDWTGLAYNAIDTIAADTLTAGGFAVSPQTNGKTVTAVIYSTNANTASNVTIRLLYYDVSAGTYTPFGSGTITTGTNTITITGLSQALATGDWLYPEVTATDGATANGFQVTVKIE